MLKRLITMIVFQATKHALSFDFTIHSGIILLCIRTLNIDQWTETVVQRRALSVMFNLLCFAHM